MLVRKELGVVYVVLNHFTWVYVAIIELPHLTEFRVRPIDLPDSTWVTLPYSSAVPLLGRVFYRPNAESLVWATRGKLRSIPIERDIVDEILVFWRDHGRREHGTVARISGFFIWLYSRVFNLDAQRSTVKGCWIAVMQWWLCWSDAKGVIKG